MSRVKLHLLTDTNMLLMAARSIRRGICYAIFRYPKTNNKYMPDYDNPHNKLLLMIYLKEQKSKKLKKLWRIVLVKNTYIYISNLKQALNNELVLKKVQRTIKFNLKTWFKSNFGMNTDLKKTKNDSGKDFLWRKGIV